MNYFQLLVLREILFRIQCSERIIPFQEMFFVKNKCIPYSDIAE